MLVDEEDSNILPFRRESVKSFFDSCIIRLTVNYQEVLLRVRRLRNMLRLN